MEQVQGRQWSQFGSVRGLGKGMGSLGIGGVSS